MARVTNDQYLTRRKIVLREWVDRHGALIAPVGGCLRVAAKQTQRCVTGDAMSRGKSLRRLTFPVPSQNFRTSVWPETASNSVWDRRFN
jgi:hypothetical protein